MREKRKLTLSVDAEVIQRARELGINISEITEAVLQGFAFTPDRVDRKTTQDKYGQLCRGMLPLLQEFGVEVEIGDIARMWEPGEETTSCIHDPDNTEVRQHYYMKPDGSFSSESKHIDHSNEPELTICGPFRDEVRLNSIELSHLLPPKDILSNFIKALSSAKDKRQRLEELEMAIRVVDAMTRKRQPDTERVISGR